MARDIPIIYSAPMVLALLREVEAPGTGKTMTRRLGWRTKWNAGGPVLDAAGAQMDYVEPHEVRLGPSPWRAVRPGDRLWVRETLTRSGGCISYAAGYKPTKLIWPVTWKQDPRPSIHMPREFSRLTLVVTGTKIERLHDISDDDVGREGLLPWGGGDIGSDNKWHRLFHSAVPGNEHSGDCAPDVFRELWDYLHGPGSWKENPELVALTFTVHQCNIDAMPEAA